MQAEYLRQQLMKKATLNLEESKEEYILGFRERKLNGEMM